MALNPNKTAYPVASDLHVPHLDMQRLGVSVKHVTPVANMAERNAVATALGASSANPVYTDRADAGAGAELEVTRGGGVWRTIYADNPWLNLTLAAGWTVAYSGGGPQYRKRGDSWELRGSAYYAAGIPTTVRALTTGSPTPTPAAFGTTVLCIAALGNAGSAVGMVNPRADGNIQTYATATGGTILHLDGIRFRAA